jgi:NTP pyrophosphatase (non-canonical NTP hydrolase)
MGIKQYQELIKKIYYVKDSQRGLAKTYNWLTEEIGELARAIRKGNRDTIREEFADCLAWLLSVGTILGIDAEDAMKKYAKGCPKCGKIPCACKEDGSG